MNGNGLNLSAVDIEGLQLATDLVDDRVVICAGIAHVPWRFVRKLPDGVSVGIVEEQIRGAIVSIGNKGDIIANPHRIFIRRIDVRDLLDGTTVGIDDPKRWYIPAAMF